MDAVLTAPERRTLLPRSRSLRLADAGHMLPYEQPRALADAVLGFLAHA